MQAGSSVEDPARAGSGPDGPGLVPTVGDATDTPRDTPPPVCGCGGVGSPEGAPPAPREASLLDSRNVSLMMPVRVRDGDECRFCRAVVDWRTYRTRSGGAFVHLRPGEPVSIDTVVVSCRECCRLVKLIVGQGFQTVPLPPPDRPFFDPCSSSLQEVVEFMGATPPEVAYWPHTTQDTSEMNRKALRRFAFGRDVDVSPGMGRVSQPKLDAGGELL